MTVGPMVLEEKLQEMDRELANLKKQIASFQNALLRMHNRFSVIVTRLKVLDGQDG